MLSKVWDSWCGQPMSFVGLESIWVLGSCRSTEFQRELVWAAAHVLYDFLKARVSFVFTYRVPVPTTYGYILQYTGRFLRLALCPSSGRKLWKLLRNSLQRCSREFICATQRSQDPSEDDSVVLASHTHHTLCTYSPPISNAWATAQALAALNLSVYLACLLALSHLSQRRSRAIETSQWLTIKSEQFCPQSSLLPTTAIPSIIQ